MALSVAELQPFNSRVLPVLVSSFLQAVRPAKTDRQPISATEQRAPVIERNVTSLFTRQRRQLTGANWEGTWHY